MLIYLFRHGIAIDRTDPASPVEEERFLTEKGIRRTLAAAKGMAALGIRPSRILSSPFLRARQTAELAAEALGFPKDKLELTDALLWDAAPSALVATLGGLASDGVLCVGHAPHLDHFVAHMIGNPLPVTELKKASLTVIESDFSQPGDGTLLALYPPSALRKIAKRG